MPYSCFSPSPSIQIQTSPSPTRAPFKYHHATPLQAQSQLTIHQSFTTTAINYLTATCNSQFITIIEALFNHKAMAYLQLINHKFIISHADLPLFLIGNHPRTQTNLCTYRQAQSPVGIIISSSLPLSIYYGHPKQLFTSSSQQLTAQFIIQQPPPQSPIEAEPVLSSLSGVFTKPRAAANSKTQPTSQSSIQSLTTTDASCRHLSRAQ
jgi:hypothetical protein